MAIFGFGKQKEQQQQQEIDQQEPNYLEPLLAQNRNIPYPDYKDEFMKWQLSPEDVLEEIEHKLKGEVFDLDKGKWLKRYKQLLNQDGINMLMGFLRAHLNKIILLTDLKEEDINRMTLNCCSSMVDLLALRFNDFEMEQANLTPIALMIEHNIYATLRRAFMGGDRKLIGLVTQRQEHIINNMQQQQHKNKGFFGLFK